MKLTKFMFKSADYAKKLIDTTSRNRLIDLKGALLLRVLDFAEFTTRSNSQKQELALFDEKKRDGNERWEKFQKLLEKIRAKQNSVLNEKGFNPTRFTYGALKFKDGENTRTAPLYLTEAKVNKKHGLVSVERISKDFEFNFALKEKLQQDFGIKLPVEIIDTEGAKDLYVINEKIKQLTKALTDCCNFKSEVLQGEMHLSCFDSDKMALYEEIVNFEKEIDEVIDDLFSKGDFGNDTPEHYIDEKISHKNLYTFLECDSSQLQCINRAVEGKSFVIQGPPGTGKTQTICNIISQLVSCGKKILFVSEKKAAIDAVMKKFKEKDLDHVFLDLHDKKTSATDIRQQIINIFDKKNEDVKSMHLEDLEDASFQLDRNVKKLNKRQKLLHKRESFCWADEKSHNTLYTLENELDKINIKANLASKNFFFVNTDISKEVFREIEDFLKEDLIKEYQQVYQSQSKPWVEVELKKPINNENELQLFCENIINRNDAIKEIAKMHENLDNILNNKGEINFVCNEVTNENTFLMHTKNLLRVSFDLGQKNNNVLKKFQYGLLFLFRKIKRNKLRKILSSLQGESHLKQQELNSLLLFTPNNHNEIGHIVNAINNIFLQTQKQAMAEENIKQYTTLNENLNDLVKNKDIALLSIKYKNVFLKRVEALGILDFWEKFLQSSIDMSFIFNFFKKCLIASEVENIKSNIDIDIKNVAKNVKEFKDFDEKFVMQNHFKLKQFLFEEINGISDQSRRDLFKWKNSNSRPGMRPRKFINSNIDTIRNVVNCVVCSPITIANFFSIKSPKEKIFDTVIFDEASQIFLEEGISSIIRANQIIVCGDRNQMPPNNMFKKSEGDGEDDEEIEDDSEYESLLDFISSKILNCPLKWHYRSKFEELITPSNQTVYNGELITFPCAENQILPIEIEYIQNGVWDHKRKNDLEADAVIAKLRSLFKDGQRSIGIIAINEPQRSLIEDKINEDEELRAYYEESESSPDGLFVKNLENCQGDEREIIIISTTYGNKLDGKINGSMFRQINNSNGYRRLNVMFSRARAKVYVFTSIDISDRNFQRLVQNNQNNGNRGLQFLKHYLQYAKNNCKNYDFIQNQDKSTKDDFDSFFEEDVYNHLRNLGFDLDKQVGCSNYRIDLAIKSRSGYLLGIECDGEAYHSGKTARERDRLRQSILESKGWKIHRIWYYDWRENKDAELKKIQSKIQECNSI